MPHKRIRDSRQVAPSTIKKTRVPSTVVINLEDFHYDTLSEILAYLDPKTLVRCRRVSKKIGTTSTLRQVRFIYPCQLMEQVWIKSVVRHFGFPIIDNNNVDFATFLFGAIMQHLKPAIDNAIVRFNRDLLLKFYNEQDIVVSEKAHKMMLYVNDDIRMVQFTKKDESDYEEGTIIFPHGLEEMFLNKRSNEFRELEPKEQSDVFQVYISGFWFSMSRF
jgi:hypothetical protein